MRLEKVAMIHTAELGSTVQQRIPLLKTEHLLEANWIPKEIILVIFIISFKTNKAEVENGAIVMFSHTAFNISTARTYGQSKIISSAIIRDITGRLIQHILERFGKKQERMSQSLYSAEMKACTKVDVRGHHLKGNILTMSRMK